MSISIDQLTIEDEIKSRPSLIYASQIHDQHNCMYDSQPFSFHLERVVQRTLDALQNTNAFTEAEKQSILDAAALHDIMEDCGVPYQHLANIYGIATADIVFAVTNVHKKSRIESIAHTLLQMAWPNVSSGVTADHIAIVKLCDRISNLRAALELKRKVVEEGFSSNFNYNKSINHYVAEYPLFTGILKPQTTNDFPQDLWTELDALITLAAS